MGVFTVMKRKNNPERTNGSVTSRPHQTRTSARDFKDHAQLVHFFEGISSWDFDAFRDAEHVECGGQQFEQITLPGAIFSNETDERRFPWNFNLNAAEIPPFAY